ncbi:hypothetical protein KM043_007054 [Ampulex compressa]|nr:hypothetical protein KM043_007054 [Ampulex compressa]
MRKGEKRGSGESFGCPKASVIDLHVRNTADTCLIDTTNSSISAAGERYLTVLKLLVLARTTIDGFLPVCGGQSTSRDPPGMVHEPLIREELRSDDVLSFDARSKQVSRSNYEPVLFGCTPWGQVRHPARLIVGSLRRTTQRDPRSRRGFVLVGSWVVPMDDEEHDVQRRCTWWEI